MKKLAYLSVLLLALGLASMAMAEEVKKYPNAPIEARVVPSAATQVAEDQAKEAKEESGLSGEFSLNIGGYVNDSGQVDSRLGTEACLWVGLDEGRTLYIEPWWKTGGSVAFNEFDFKSGKIFELGDSGYVLDIFTAIFAIHPYGQVRNDYWDLGVKLSKTLELAQGQSLNFSANLQYAVALGEEGRGGFHGKLTGVYAINKVGFIPGTPDIRLGARLAPRVGKTFGIEDGLFLIPSAQVVWSLPGGLKIGPKIEQAIPITSFEEDKGGTVYSLGITWEF